MSHETLNGIYHRNITCTIYFLFYLTSCDYKRWQIGKNYGFRIYLQKISHSGKNSNNEKLSPKSHFLTTVALKMRPLTLQNPATKPL